ncbi:porin [Flexibacterium corallicola]|uniref:porin n=1 Tax=Flexibacterium corallicola TaxID=3037259 RepID=UPI00286F1AEF|nr:porin [Pseudovibrio sp. M1P-2-3]
MKAKFLAIFGLPLGISAGQAADLSTSPESFQYAEPANYVEVCDAFGQGFYYIPGTSTCLRLGGRVRVEAQALNFGSKPNNWDQRERNGMRFRARSDLMLETYTDSEFGLIKAYAELQATVDSTEAWAAGNATNSDPDLRRGERTDMHLEAAYIQMNGFTFGRTASFFDFFTGATYGSVDRNWSDENTWVAGYTAALGNGLSLSLSAEDMSERTNGVYVWNGVNGAGGSRAPAGVIAMRLDQAWGAIQLSGAVQDVRPLSQGRQSKAGWAIGAGTIINLPMLGDGDAIALQVQYADAALRYLNVDDVFDVYYLDDHSGKTQGIAVSGGYTHYFTPEVRVDFDTSYVDVDTPEGAPQNDYSRWAFDWDVAWAPVNGLEFGVDFGIARTDVKHEDDYTEASALLRVQRTF